MPKRLFLLVGILASAGPVCSAFGSINQLNPTYTGVATDDFCRSPYDAVCGNPTTNHDARAARIEAFRVRNHQRVMAIVAAELGHGSDPLFDLPQLMSLSIEDQAKGIAVYATNMTRFVRTELGALESRIHSTNTQMVRTLVQRAIVGQVRSAFDQWLYLDDMLEGLRQAQVVSASELWSADHAVGARSAIRNAAQSGFMAFCGPDGMRDNAFATSDGTRGVLMFCPGWLAGAVGSGEDSNGNFRNMLMVAGHEFGHLVDTRTYQSLYGGLSGCLAEHHSSGLLLSEEGRVRDWLSSHFRAHQARRKVFQHQSEIVADFWAAQASVEAVRILGDSFTREDRLQLLREGLSGLCGSDDDGEHPSARWRIETIFALDPGIRQFMGCGAPSHGRPGCTLQGAHHW